MRFILLILLSLAAALLIRPGLAAPLPIRAVTSFGWDGYGGTFSDAMIKAMKADVANTLVFAVTSTGPCSTA